MHALEITAIPALRRNIPTAYGTYASSRIIVTRFLHRRKLSTLTARASPPFLPLPPYIEINPQRAEMTRSVPRIPSVPLARERIGVLLIKFPARKSQDSVLHFKLVSAPVTSKSSIKQYTRCRQEE